MEELDVNGNRDKEEGIQGRDSGLEQTHGRAATEMQLDAAN
jgi:hypothetical protein